MALVNRRPPRSGVPDPQRRVRYTVAAGLCTVAAACVALAGRAGPAVLVSSRVPVSGYGTSEPAGSATAAAGRAPLGFRISGRTSQLRPGGTVQLTLTVTNPNARPITVTSVTTAVSAASAQCGGSFVTVGAFHGGLAVTARGSAQLTVTATMAHAAPDACQGAVFPFTYHGSGVVG
jgi:hypothetical protein